MTKQERLAIRKANKEKRKARRELRKAQFNELLTRVNETPALPPDGTAPDYVTGFKTYWPLVKAALQFAESAKITREKMDLNINRIIQIGDNMAGNPGANPDAEFIEKIQKTWRIVRTILIAITIFITKEQTDEKVDRIIEIGDWVTDLEGNT